jgi:putative IMPACT (imprinted ancient) family translation regulator
MLTLAGRHRHEEEVKRSRFIALVDRADSPDAALAFLELIRDVDATHNCWAYKVDDKYRFSDDGEPGGSAGRPILAAIEGQGLDHVVAVVIRYFGGTKLGVGGLVLGVCRGVHGSKRNLH